MGFLKSNKVLGLLFLTVFCYHGKVKAQIASDTGDIFIEVSSIISGMPGSSGQNYANPNQTQLNTWDSIITRLLNEDYAIAATNANSLGYDLIEFSDTSTSLSHTYYILRSDSSNYWGSYIYNPGYCRTLIIQSPHPKNDLNTGKEGVHVFRETNALFFCLSGTHRCNSSQFSSCDGSTSVCSGSSEDYRISDLAHNDSSIFQKTTEVLFNSLTDPYFIQLHGFAKLSSDPYVILSNGTQLTPSPDYLLAFRNQLFNEDNSLTFKTAHIDSNWTRLIGKTNTQGRFINGSTNSCISNATNTNGRFFHIEQEKTKLRDNINGWNKVAKALKNVFQCEVLSADSELDRNRLRIYPNPATNKFKIVGPELNIREIKLYSISGRDLTNKIQLLQENDNTIQIDITSLLTGSYILKSNTTARMVFKK